MMPFAFMQNPVMQEELAHQRRVLNKPQPTWWRWLERGMFWGALVVCLILFGSEVVYGLTGSTAQPIANGTNMLLILTIAYVLGLHFVVIFRTLAFGYNAIVRERESDNWEKLIQSGVDANDIVLGKWWATVLSMWPSFIRLSLLRGTLIVWLGSVGSASSFLHNFGFREPFGPPPAPMSPSVSALLVMATFIALLTLANSLFTAAAGIAASAAAPTKRTAQGSAVVVRVGSLLACVVLLALSCNFGFGGSTGIEISFATALNLLDNGATLASSLSRFSNYRQDTSITGAAIITWLLTLSCYLLLTGWLLRLAERRAIKQGAVRPAPR